MALEGWQIALIVIGSVLVTYTVGSAVALRCPPFWVKRKRRWPHDSWRIAHRGGSMIGPENTIYTIRKGLDMGVVDMIELDVGMTRDGVVVVTHDEDTIRTCGVARVVKDTNFADLPELAQTMRLHFPAPHTHEYTMPDDEWHKVGPQPHCTLRELLEAFPTTLLHIDCKHESTEMVHKAVALVREFRREHITIMGATRKPNWLVLKSLSDSPPPSSSATLTSAPTAKANAPVTATDPSTPLQQPTGPAPPLYLFSCMEQVVATMVMYYLGILPFVPLNFDVFDIPLPTPELKRVLDRPFIAWMLDCPKLWRHLRARGIRVYGFVVNDRPGMELVRRSWPLDGIMTDDPNLFVGLA